MLDGRIDMQGTVKELRESGALEAITLEEAIEERREDEQKADEGEEAEASEVVQSEAAADGENADGDSPAKKTKKARKLVKDEERETGGVKWKIYKTYLKASSVFLFLSYVILAPLIEVNLQVILDLVCPDSTCRVYAGLGLLREVLDQGILIKFFHVDIG